MKLTTQEYQGKDFVSSNYVTCVCVYIHTYVHTYVHTVSVMLDPCTVCVYAKGHGMSDKDLIKC